MSSPIRMTPCDGRAVVAALLLSLAGATGCDPGRSTKEGSGPGAPATVSNVTPVAALAFPVVPARPASLPVPVAAVVPLTNMVPIKAGSFQRQKHRVTVSRDFWLGKFEVTQAEYAEVTGQNPSHFTNQTNAPVEKVTHVDASAYCVALTQRERQAGRLSATYEYRLPSEAEWEYACRAGTTNLFSFGDSKTEAEEYAWTWENSDGTTHPIGLKKPNPWGLHDMHGNVWEWTEDWFGPYPAADVTDPAGVREGKGRVFRGGGWNNESQFARSANRFAMAPASGIHFVGFRVALGRVRNVGH